MTRTEFFHLRFGKNWVIHRRTERILRRYGPDVVCVSPKKYYEAERDWEFHRAGELGKEYGLTADAVMEIRLVDFG